MSHSVASRALKARPYLLRYSSCTQRTSRASRISYRPVFHRSFSGNMASGPSKKMADTPIERNDPYAYTSGRWLRRDEIEQKSRFIQFDFDALRRRIIELCPGASSITSYDKMEGGNNRVFIFHTDNGKRIVARLPFPHAGPSRLATASEVATIKYLQAKTSIPIPKVLDWSDDASNAIGREYIIMEHAPGISLLQRWPTMEIKEQLRCIAALYRKLKEVTHIEFPGYGSLYFNDTTYITARKIPLDQKFCIGPHCGSDLWNCNVTQPKYYHHVNPNQGPWPQFDAYCDGLIDTGLSKIPPAGSIPNGPRYQGSIESHHELLRYGRAVVKEMAKNPRIHEVAGPIMFHPDLHKRNIFVSEDDPTVITAIIDWQSTGILPAFWYVHEVPDFAEPIPDPSDEDKLEPKSEACAKAHNVCTQFLTPQLAKPRLMDQSFFRPFWYCGRTWEDGIVAFRQELIKTSQKWSELGLAGSCPFPLPSPDEHAIHQKHYKFFETSQLVKRMLSRYLGIQHDGWVPSETWETIKPAYMESFKVMVREVLGKETPDEDMPLGNEADVREIWPFELKE